MFYFEEGHGSVVVMFSLGQVMRGLRRVHTGGASSSAVSMTTC